MAAGVRTFPTLLPLARLDADDLDVEGQRHSSQRMVGVKDDRLFLDLFDLDGKGGAVAVSDHEGEPDALRLGRNLFFGHLDQWSYSPIGLPWRHGDPLLIAGVQTSERLF